MKEFFLPKRRPYTKLSEKRFKEGREAGAFNAGGWREFGSTLALFTPSEPSYKVRMFSLLSSHEASSKDRAMRLAEGLAKKGFKRIIEEQVVHLKNGEVHVSRRIDPGTGDFEYVWTAWKGGEVMQRKVSSGVVKVAGCEEDAMNQALTRGIECLK